MKDEDGRAKLYADIAHPINSACREMIQQRVIVAFEEEKARAKLPGYVPSYEEIELEDGAPGRRRRFPGFAVGRRGGADSGRGEAAGPHKLPAGQHAPGQPHTRKPGFGAGIFE